MQEHKPLDLYQLNPCSNNKKTGPIPVSMHNSGTCPAACPMRKNGCMGDCGPLNFNWRKLDEGRLKNQGSIEYLVEKIICLDKYTSIWRAAQAGDLPGDGTRLNHGACIEIALANRSKGYNRGGFTYTHYSPIPIDGLVSVEDAEHNYQVIHDMIELGFMVNLSANNLKHADELYDIDLAPVAVILPHDTTRAVRTPKGRLVCICPAFLRESITCRTCRLCKKSRKAILGLPAHGGGWKKAQNVYNTW